MPTSHKLSLRARLLLLVALILLAGYVLILTALTQQTGKLQQETTWSYTEQLAISEGHKATAELERGMDAARTLAHALGQLKVAGLANRANADALLKGVLAGNPAFLGVWSGWEPNAFDGKDNEYANQPGHDATGRYVPYWNRGSGQLVVEPLTDYTKPGAGDYYLLPQKTGQETLIEPYKYTVAGKEMLITSLVVPVHIEGRFVGVVGVDLALESLQKVTAQVKVFERGYASLLSHSGIFLGDVDSSRLGQPLGNLPERAQALQAIAAGQTLRTQSASGHLGNEEVSRIYVPLHIGNSKNPWSFAVTVPQKEVMAAVYQQRWLAAGLGSVSLVLVLLALAWAVQHLVIRPIGGEPEQAALIATQVAQGDLSQPVVVQPNDQSSLMAQLQQMQQGLAGVVAKVREGAEGVATASSQIAQGNQDLSGRTESQASALEETAASMSQLGSAVTQNADHARQANDLARHASGVAVQGGEAVGRVIATMKEINDSSRKIADIISVIDGIAFQTNILALNAAVEAARAGEQGRGFAVVAAEVRSLAGRSANAAKEIKALIDASVGRVELGASQVDQAGSTMTEVVSAIQRVTDIMGEISSASAQQSAGVAQVGEAVMQMDQVTQQNAALVEEMAAAASSLKVQAQELVQTVSVFQLANGSQRSSVARRTGPALAAPSHVSD
ncbi:MAG: methyl-accepting chemotaxis protein [Giesbergeria sp.]|uniref:methyl-accepting chemotaxis protein n=1 Tax=Giesbergeria sp. TaxID=2818473 RepID=UPI002602B7BF|nr:methyl-accepting chemotaxis protein [Giesbergeria sp.]MDD2609218.1 methyl-accepting chemotaxis protein [Giesbergeria sp.]